MPILPYVDFCIFLHILFYELKNIIIEGACSLHQRATDGHDHDTHTQIKSL